MSVIASVATAVPDTRVDQDTAREFARERFAGRVPDLDRLLSVFEHAGIRTRYFAVPEEWFFTSHDLAEKSALYVREATRLSARAARDALAAADLTPDDVDAVIYVNTTGLATPSIDARLVNELGLRPDVHRSPLWGLGCAGGAAGLAHAHRAVQARPDAVVLLIAAEFCGLTFLPDDTSKSNLVATALFADGVGAAVVRGEGEGIRVLDARSRFHPDTLDVMGWTVLQEGLQVVFAKRIPDIVRETAAADFGAFLGDHGLGLGDMDALIFHPGGVKVLEAYMEALELPPERLALSAGVLRDYGNMSSATVLFVLARYLEAHGVDGGGRGLLSALGPGFCSESLLLEL